MWSNWQLNNAQRSLLVLLVSSRNCLLASFGSLIFFLKERWFGKWTFTKKKKIEPCKAYKKVIEFKKKINCMEEILKVSSFPV